MKKYILFLLLIFLYACGGNADKVNIGEKAPDFSLQDQHGEKHSLSEHQGNVVVLYFYPKAGTPGCTTQACGIRDDYSEFENEDIIVYGISVDDKEALMEFSNENSLNFPVLADENKSVAKKYGVLNNAGFANRITFIIDKSGNIAEIIRDVDVDTHAGDVLAKTKALK